MRIAGGQAAIGIFITLKKLKQTPTMEKEIANAGMLNFSGVAQYPRLLFWSIEEHFDGAYPRLPNRAHPRSGKALPIGISDETESMQPEPSPQASIDGK